VPIKISSVIQASELVTSRDNRYLMIFDVSNGKDAKLNYNAKHLEGAIFVDLNTELAEIQDDIAIGGRHPLPKIENFCKTLGKMGISEKSHIVLYDDKNGSNASARFWWMLKSVGHRKVQVLNGGFKEAEKAGFPISSDVEITAKEKSYKSNGWQLKIADIDEVENVSQNENCIVIDVREEKRFNGEIEPIDLIAGHIPGAINVPFTENLDDDGLFLPSSELKKKFKKIIGNTKSENVIVHCGSGVTACHTLLAMDYAGLEIPKLYVGSWSEWSRNGKKMISKKD
jgi:thiosulfate/3-mercaptopyruvate sulfurtransferase